MTLEIFCSLSNSERELWKIASTLSSWTKTKLSYLEKHFLEQNGENHARLFSYWKLYDQKIYFRHLKCIFSAELGKIKQNQSIIRRCAGLQDLICVSQTNVKGTPFAIDLSPLLKATQMLKTQHLSRAFTKLKSHRLFAFNVHSTHK